MKAVETVTGRGHMNILAESKTTFQITKDTHLTKRGDCIIAVAADKAVKDLNCRIKEILQSEASKLEIIIEVNSEKETIMASGSPDLILRHNRDMVVRKSDYICERTLAIKASKGAKDLSRHFVAKLSTAPEVHLTLIAENGM